MGNRSKLIIFVLSAVFLWVTVSFNACSKAEFSQNTKTGIGKCVENPQLPECITPAGNRTNIVDVTKGGKVDILFVIDNSETMSFEHQSTASRISNFLSNIQDLDWQIAVTTTNVADLDAPGVDGRFVPLSGMNGAVILNKNTANAQSVLGATIQNETVSASVAVGGNDLGKEQGMYAAYRAVERYAADLSSEQRAFFRDGAQLAIVVISDEKEATYLEGGPHSGLSGYHSFIDHKNDPEDLNGIVKYVFNSRKNLAFHSIIAITDECLNTEGRSLGKSYRDLSYLTGGIVGSVCSTDYGNILSDIGDSVVENQQSISLECVPEAGTLKIELQAEGSDQYNTFSGGYSLNGSLVYFDQQLAYGKYKVTYVCPPQ